MPSAGRPSKCTPDVQQRIISALEAGAPWVTACAHGGIATSTLDGWRKRARMGVEPYAGFMAEANRARDRSALRWLAKLQKIADEKDDWRAYAWLLARVHPQDFAERRTIDARVSGGTTLDAVAVLLGSLTDVLPEPDGDGDDDE